MADNSHISWTTHTANFWIGCIKVSPLCDLCYAERDTNRWGGNFEEDRKMVAKVWHDIPRWEKDAAATGIRPRVFVMSLGDFFERLPTDHKDYEAVADARTRAIALMESTTHLDYLLLTKRISNVPKMVPQWVKDWPQHIRLGISVGTQPDADRDIPRLLQIPAPNFLSMEPLLEGVYIGKWIERDPSDYNGLHRRGIDWVVTGGESASPGQKPRPGNPDWYRSLRDQCAAAGVPFHFKQWGEWIGADQIAADGHRVAFRQTIEPFSSAKVKSHTWPDGSQSLKIGKRAAGHLLDGVEHFEFPRPRE